MSRSLLGKLTGIKNRLKFVALATLFVGTQVIFPLSFTSIATADAADPVNASTVGSVSVDPTSGAVTVTMNGAWQWTTHSTDCNTDRYAVGWAVAWNDSSSQGNLIGNVNGLHAYVGTPTDNTVHYVHLSTDGGPNGDPVGTTRCGVYGQHGVDSHGHAIDYNTGDWGPISHTYPAGTTSVQACVVTYDVHLSKNNDPTSGAKSGDLTAGGSGHNGDNSVEQNGDTPLGDGCFTSSLAQLTVVKHVVNGYGGTKTASDFTMNVTATNPSESSFAGSATGKTITLDPGTYSVSETADPDYATTYSSSCSGTAVAGQIAICTVTNTQVPPPGMITIVKDAVPDSSTPFSFTASGSGVSNFSLTDDGTSSNSKQFGGLAAGDYVFTETEPSGWDFGNISCSNGSSVTQNSTTVTVHLSAGQSVTCTYTNRQRGTLTVHKVTSPASDPTGFPITASTSNGNIAGNASRTLSTSQDVTYDVSQGTYNVSEDLTNTPGWHQDSNTCSNVVVSANNLNPTCTITNTKLAKLKIVKSTNPASSSQAFSFGSTGPSITGANGSFVLDTNNNDNTYPNNFQYTDLLPGTYTVNETEPGGWKLTDLSCTGITYSWNGSTQTLSLNVAAGADITCTFTNTQLTSITGTKFEVNADSSTVGTVKDWTIYLLVNGNQVDHTTTDASGNYSFSGLLPGSYTLAEATPAGWTPIYGPGGVNLTAGNDSTGNNFGNFQNAEISGYKFNDLNGDHNWDNGEPGLSGWTVTVYDNGGSGSTLNHQVAQTTTAGDGSYSFTNLPPNDYKVCETAQTGWTQTYPTTNGGCQLVTVALSGFNYTHTDFGNQGRGTITVVKNVDSNGDGTIDFQDVTNWNWNIDGSGNFTTGSGNSQNVAAGNYTVSEVQKSGYHVTASSCSGQGNQGVSTSQDVTVSAGDNVICTFTNTRDTGTVTVNKVIDPSNDNGKFDLHVNGATSATATDQGNGGTTGAVSVVTDTYTVSETAGTNTNMSDYTSTYSCDNGVNGDTTTSTSFTINSGDNVTCTFTNTRLANLTVVKDAVPDDQQTFNFHFGNVPGINQIINPTVPLVPDTPFTLQDDPGVVSQYSNSQQFTGLLPGSYYISEDSVSGWDLTNIDCGRGVSFTKTGSEIQLTIAAGADITCTYTNTERGSITIVKDAQPDSPQAFDFTGNLGQFSLTDDGTNDGLNSQDFTGLVPDTYSVTEPSVKGWSLDTVICNTTQDVNTNTREVNIHLQPGQNVICTFTNSRDTGTVTVNKVIDPSTDGGLFNLNINGETTYTATDQPNGGTTGAQTVVSGDYTASETAGTNTNMNDYTSTYSCDNGSSGDGTTTPSFSVDKGDNVSCTFTNMRKATIIVTKYNDLNLNGTFDPNGNPAEPALPGWDISLGDTNQTTGADGSTTFTDVLPSEDGYPIDEVLQDGWNRSVGDNGSNVYCVYPDEEIGRTNDGVYRVFPGAGDVIHCYVGNYQNPELQIVKSNNRPDPTVDGDTVTYTITVTVPDDSGAIFDDTVTDLPPDNFTYVPGSWTADSSIRGDLKAGDITGEPTYGSPGIWHLGTLLPGEIVTLTYKAIIGSIVSNGTYPDLAFTSGFASQFHIGNPNVTGGCANSSCLNALGQPFVTTVVTVGNGPSTTPVNFTAGQVLGDAVLVNTGPNLLWAEFVLPPLLIAGVYITRRATHYQEKGGK